MMTGVEAPDETSSRHSTSPGTRRFRPGFRQVGGWLLVPALGISLVGSLVIALTLGPAGIGAGPIVESLGYHLNILPMESAGSARLSPVQEAIIWQLRLPRILTAVIVGAGLAISGVIIQALTRNPLADPYLLGLSAGASLGAVSVLLLGISLALPVAAFVGAMLALVITLGIAAAAGSTSPATTILAGLAVSSAAAAATSFVIFWAAEGDSYHEILNWLLGSLAGADWSSVVIAAAAFLLVGVPLLFSGGILDGFVFGDDTARSLGLNVTALRWGLLSGTAVLTGAMVSVSGSIGFIGLILPHIVRLVVGTQHRPLLPATALTGAIFMLWTDTLARTLFDPREIPVGIITALVGAPLFAALILRRSSN